MGFLSGKRALIVGIASTRSIAYGIAQAMHREGAELAFTYQNERLKERVDQSAAEFGSTLSYPCDVSQDADIQNLFSKLTQDWPDGLDIVVHSVAYAPPDQLSGDYVEQVTRQGFNIAHEISSYSFVALAKAARPLLRENAALITLSYLGAEKALPNYNVMGLAKASLEANIRYMALSMGTQGVRVNGISAGPIRTLAASGIKDLRKMLSSHETTSPLKRNVTQEEVGNVAAFLCSDLASGVTGEVVHVDSGVHMVGLGL